MAEEFDFLGSEIQNFIAEADADLSPVDFLHGRCRYGVLLSPIVGMEEFNYITDADRSNFRKIRVARMSARMETLLITMGFWCLNMTNWVRYTPPPLFWALPPWRAFEVEVRYPPPNKRGISAIRVRNHMKTRQNACDAPSEILSRKGIVRYSAFLKHAFREVTSGFCKGTVPGAPLVPSPGSLRMLKTNSKETYLVPLEGHILVKNM